jgi:hypothetical protein
MWTYICVRSIVTSHLGLRNGWATYIILVDGFAGKLGDRICVEQNLNLLSSSIEAGTLADVKRYGVL